MIIIQLLKDTKYPANYQIIIDSSLGNYAVLRDFFSALSLVNGRVPASEALREGWSEAEVCAEELPLHGRPCMEENAAASGSSCELANPAQVRQIASQTGDLLRQMRFVAGRGADAEVLLAVGAVAKHHREYTAGRPTAKSAKG